MKPSNYDIVPTDFKVLKVTTHLLTDKQKEKIAGLLYSLNHGIADHFDAGRTVISFDLTNVISLVHDIENQINTTVSDFNVDGSFCQIEWIKKAA